MGWVRGQEIAGDGEGSGYELGCGVVRMGVTNITIKENKTRDFYHRRDVRMSLPFAVA